MAVLKGTSLLDIPNYEGHYQVSNQGEIYSLKKNKKLFTRVHTKGYLEVELFKNGKGKIFKVHRLVALAFLGNSDLQVNHIDGNKKNNCVDNLEWVTPKENQQHAIKNGLFRKAGSRDNLGRFIKSTKNKNDGVLL